MNDFRASTRRLRRLPSAHIAPGEPDLRGWLTLAHDGRRVGRVHDVIVDVVTLHVRHLEIRLDPPLACAAGTTRLVIPVDALELAAARRHVHVRGISSNELVHAPRFGARPVDELVDASLRRFYQCPAASEPARFWGIRRRGRERLPYARIGRVGA